MPVDHKDAMMALEGIRIHQGLKSEYDVLHAYIDALELQCRSAKIRADTMRSLVDDCVDSLGNGGSTRGASDGFASYAPEEVRLCVKKLREERDAALHSAGIAVRISKGLKGGLQ